MATRAAQMFVAGFAFTILEFWKTGNAVASADVAVFSFVVIRTHGRVIW
jgi:hypothetical protein